MRRPFPVRSTEGRTNGGASSASLALMRHRRTFVRRRRPPPSIFVSSHRSAWHSPVPVWQSKYNLQKLSELWGPVPLVMCMKNYCWFTRKSSRRSAVAGLLIPLVLGCFALSPLAQAVSPPPDGGYPGHNTAEGTDALFSLTFGGSNTATGFHALYYNTTGSYNTATGDTALYSNTTGSYNTANGDPALYSNTTASYNTANGDSALALNTTGANNTATGYGALISNTTGSQNTAIGANALVRNTTSNFNTAEGVNVLFNNTTGSQNTATGVNALLSNTVGSFNTANGVNALYRSTGGSNIALGSGAGSNLTTGSSNIDIGSVGVAGESNTIRIGSVQTRTFIKGISGVALAGAAVVVNAAGQLGVAASSARFKGEIKPMDKESDAILALKPVTFHYKKELDPDGTLQFGLVAEEVEKVNPDLVVRDKEGKPYTVRYDQVNAMLLNEFLKEHKKVQNLEATVAQQRQEMKTVIARLGEHDSRIQRVSDQLELSQPAQKVIASRP